ncbi:MAG: hypothetical protein IPL43_11250 [Micropruina sp.]|nr:hypothetical protein [Micropruina sp.]
MLEVAAALWEKWLPRQIRTIEKKLGHATVGQVALSEWLRHRFGCGLARAHTYACVVGGHHGSNPDDGDLIETANSPENVGTGPWILARDEILTKMATSTGADKYFTKWMTRDLPIKAQTLLTGLVIVADWLASNEELFPYLDSTPTHERASRAIQAVAFAPPWQPRESNTDTRTLLRSRFPSLEKAEVRGIQEAMVKAARQVQHPPLMIVEAPMGVGKTEGALLAAEVLASRFGAGGVFVGLPTMATSNPMFDRMIEWLELADTDTSVSLAHSKAGLNDRFQGMARQGGAYRVYDDPDGADVGSRGSHVRVVSWMRGRKRAGLANHVAGTIDQGLFAGLKAKHVVLRHLALAGKVVVIDEVHASDDYMRMYLKRVLTWLGHYGTPTILMSATLPPDQRDELLNAWADGQDGEAALSTTRDDVYPRLTLHDGVARDFPVATGTADQPVTVRQHHDDPARVAETLAERLSDGGCAGVICHTVARAQSFLITSRLSSATRSGWCTVATRHPIEPRLRRAWLSC